MMNRSVMQRQMFKAGGAAGFPDMNNDGDITQADILMGRGVKLMQMGGDPMAAAPMAAAPMPPMMPQEMAGAPMPAEPPMDMAGMGVGEVDPATIEQLLGEVAPEIGNPEEAEDFETMMNSVRGDEASVEQRRMELASLVGEEDAMKTPESVLALVQPVVQMSLVDEGIGGLAEQEMQEPVEGAMAGGIMSMMGG